MKLGVSHQRPDDLNPERFAYLKRLGVEAMEVRLKSRDATRDKLAEIVETVGSADLELHEIMLDDLYSSTALALALPEREEHLARIQEFVRDLGELGVRHTTYAWHTGGMYMTHRDVTRGVSTRAFDQSVVDAAPRVVERDYPADELWENYAWFMERLLPVAEEAGVKLQLHPNDPPLDHQGVARIFKSTDAFRRAMTMADNSPNSGILFCVGTWAEMHGPAGEGEDVIQALREFGARGQVLQVHLRNVSAPMPNFAETFPDDGYLDLHGVMDALVEVGFDGMIVPDHVPGEAHEKPINEAYTLGYLRALIRYAQRQQQARG